MLSMMISFMLESSMAVQQQAKLQIMSSMGKEHFPAAGLLPVSDPGARSNIWVKEKWDLKLPETHISKLKVPPLRIPTGREWTYFVHMVRIRSNV
jgi:hypothetical protein